MLQLYYGIVYQVMYALALRMHLSVNWITCYTAHIAVAPHDVFMGVVNRTYKIHAPSLPCIPYYSVVLL